jgi:hypothetical protein
MDWLFELCITALTWLIPWGSHHGDVSIVGESRMERQARWFTWTLIVIVAAGVSVYFFLKK